MKSFGNKNLIAACLICLFCSAGSTAGQAAHGAFGAVIFKSTSLTGKAALLAGGRFGWIIDSTYVIGGGFYSIASNVETAYRYPGSGTVYNLGFNYGGMELELIYPASEKIHGSLQMFIGGGGGKLLPEDGVSFSPYGFSVIILEPQVNIEFNATKWLHLGAGLGYRFASGFDEYIIYRIKDFSGMSGAVTIKLGGY